MKKIVLTGGGTAGHVMPNIALLPEIKKHFAKIYYIGTNGIEKDIISKYNEIIFEEITATKLIRSLNLKNFAIPFKLINSIREAKSILKRIRPNIVFSKGGYVSIPVVIAAKLLKIPVISHESDISMGLANKIILKFSKKMCVSFRETVRNKKCIYTGSPIRESIFNGNKLKALSLANFDLSKQTLLFMGGSLGSKCINEAVYKSLDELTKKYNVLHIVGKNNLNNLTKTNYYQTEFCSNIEDLFAFSDFVICRSGANTIFELLALKKPMLLIPLSKSQSRGDQLHNANLFQKYGYAKVLLQESLNKQTLLDSVNDLVKSKKELIKDMSRYSIKNANKNIIDIILKYST